MYCRSCADLDVTSLHIDLRWQVQFWAFVIQFFILQPMYIRAIVLQDVQVLRAIVSEDLQRLWSFA